MTPLNKVLLTLDGFVVSGGTAAMVVSLVQRDAPGAAGAGIFLGVWLMVAARDVGKHRRERRAP